MERIRKKLNKIKDSILIEDKRNISLFLLIQRYDDQEKWDILFVADWITKTNSEDDLVYLIEKIKKEFDDDLSFLSRILISTPRELFIKRIASSIKDSGKTEGEIINQLKISKQITIGKLCILSANFDDWDLSLDLVAEEGPAGVAEAHKQDFD